MLKIIIPSILCLFIVGSSALAQKNKKEIADQKLNYNKATVIIQSAIMERNAGHVKIADSLIKLSIDTYPTLEVYSYAKILMLENDIKGANNIIDKTFDRVKNFESERVCLRVFYFGVIDMRKSTVLHEHATYGLELNIPFGNLESTKKSYEVYMNNLVSYKLPLFSLNASAALGDEAYFKPRIIKQFDYKMDYFMLTKKYEEGLKYIADKPEGNYIKNDSYAPWKVEFYMKLNDDKNTLESIKDLKKSSQSYYLNLYNLKKGDTINTREFYKGLYKYNYTMGTSKMIYNEAMIDYYFHRYDSAINKLKRALAVRGTPTSFGYVQEEYKWNIYTALGDSYKALGQFEKARDAYNIALLAYPDYDRTLQSVALLEKSISETKDKDKTAPIITLLEPTSKRGLKVITATSNIQIKGNAFDISGIKQVQINNQTVYSQTSGDFWGEIALKEGINIVNISAIDLAGNIAIQNFEIERLTATANQTENYETIIPVNSKTGSNICLLIGAQNYTDLNIPSLNNPIADAIKLKIILKKDYGFLDNNIVTLFNPSKNEIKQQLIELSTRLQPEDNLIIFYAGHGIWVEKEKKGYWLMTDAKRNDVNSWLPNKDVLDLIAKIPSRHTLLITDACFSGSVFKTRGLNDAPPKAIQEMDEKISRIAITSGNDTEVPDESVFMKYLVKALSENKEKYLTAQKMFITQIIEAVMTETKTEPRYGTLELAGHVGGDFIFIKK
jgi:tetratricopeptide (TPR) repeat protein